MKRKFSIKSNYSPIRSLVSNFIRCILTSLVLVLVYCSIENKDWRNIENIYRVTLVFLCLEVLGWYFSSEIWDKISSMLNLETFEIEEEISDNDGKKNTQPYIKIE